MTGSISLSLCNWSYIYWSLLCLKNSKPDIRGKRFWSVYHQWKRRSVQRKFRSGRDPIEVISMQWEEVRQIFREIWVDVREWNKQASYLANENGVMILMFVNSKEYMRILKMKWDFETTVLSFSKETKIVINESLSHCHRGISNKFKKLREKK